MRKLMMTGVLAVFLPCVVLAGAPAYVPVQAFLTDADGNPLDGEFAITLKLYDADMGGNLLFDEVQTAMVEGGLVVVHLGSTLQLDLALFRDHDRLFLGMTIDGDPEMTPRFVIGTVPFAGFSEFSGDAQTLQGLDASEFRVVADSIDWASLENVPSGLGDGDDDTLAGLSCADGQVAQWGGTDWICVNVGTDTLAGLSCAEGNVAKLTAGAWQCASDLDSQLTEGDVDAYVANNGYALTTDLASVATSGSFHDLSDVPPDSDTLSGLNCTDGQLAEWNDSGGAWACSSPPATPPGAVMYFDLAQCPPGWSPFGAARGRVVVGMPVAGTPGGTYGSALADLAGRTIADVPAHLHTVNPPQTWSSSHGSHTHTVNPPSTTSTSAGSHLHSVNPPSTSTSTGGSHSHSINNVGSGSGTGNFQVSGNDSLNWNTGSAGSHGHTLNIAAFNSASSGSHSHALDVAQFNSGSASDHAHTLDIAGFNSGSAGTAAVDVTMPYVQLLACRKD